MFGRRKTDKQPEAPVLDLHKYREPEKADAKTLEARKPCAADDVTEQAEAVLPEAAETTEATAESNDDLHERLARMTVEKCLKTMKPEAILSVSREEAATLVENLLEEIAMKEGLSVSGEDRRDLVTVGLNEVLFEAKRIVPNAEGAANAARKTRSTLDSAKESVHPILLERIDIAKALEMPRSDLAAQITEVVDEILAEKQIQLNQMEQRDLVTLLLNDMLGLGPLEPLLADEAVTDIMVNGAKQVYVERGGKLELSGVTFRDDSHVMNIATRIVSRIGRRVDESTPLVDARLEDGSRVNVIIPPLAIDGPSISIRKFSTKKITFEVMEKQGNISPAMGKVLRIAARARLNILISGGTGSGKTTMLNALSRMIDPGERICTIEDAASVAAAACGAS